MNRQAQCTEHMVTLQHHQIPHLPRKMALMIDPRHIWNVIYNARSNGGYPPTSPNTAPATQNDSHDWSSSNMKRPLQCAEQQRLPSNITKYRPVTQNDSHDWSSSHMKHHLQCAEQQRLPSNITNYCACHAKWLSRLIRVTYETSFTMRGATEVTLQHHQILHLSGKMTLMIDPRHIWNVIYNARSNRGYPPTSPNTAPATQNDSHDWSLSHMKRHLQCAEQQRSPSNITNYWACHAKWLSWLILVTYETSFTMRGATEVPLQHHQILLFPQNFSKTGEASFIQCGADPRMIRPWNRQSATRLATDVVVSTSIFYWKIQHFALPLSFQISPNAAPATKSDTWTSPNNAPATKSDTWTSPNGAPVTKSDTCTSLLYSTLLYYSLLYYSLLFSTLLFSTIRYSTRLYSTRLYSTRLFYLLLYYSLTLLFLTLRSRSYIGSFSTKLP